MRHKISAWWPTSTPTWATIGLVILLAGCGGTATGDSNTSPRSTPPSPHASTAAPDMNAPMAALRDCVADAGFAATLLPDLTLEVQQSLSQSKAAAERIIRECEDKVIADGRYPPPPAPPTQAELLAQYAALHDLKTCLEKQGFTIAEPVSIDQFLETKGAAWHPYSSLPPDAFARAEETCPQP
jgi:hypothetical protein